MEGPSVPWESSSLGYLCCSPPAAHRGSRAALSPDEKGQKRWICCSMKASLRERSPNRDPFLFSARRAVLLRNARESQPPTTIVFAGKGCIPRGSWGVRRSCPHGLTDLGFAFSCNCREKELRPHLPHPAQDANLSSQVRAATRGSTSK